MSVDRGISCPTSTRESNPKLHWPASIRKGPLQKTAGAEGVAQQGHKHPGCACPGLPSSVALHKTGQSRDTVVGPDVEEKLGTWTVLGDEKQHECCAEQFGELSRNQNRNTVGAGSSTSEHTRESFKGADWNRCSWREEGDKAEGGGTGKSS